MSVNICCPITLSEVLKTYFFAVLKSTVNKKLQFANVGFESLTFSVFYLYLPLLNSFFTFLLTRILAIFLFDFQCICLLLALFSLRQGKNARMK